MTANKKSPTPTNAIRSAHGQATIKEGNGGIAELVTAFLLHGKARGLRPKTVNEFYGMPLTRLFVPFCQERGVESPEQITRQLVDEFAVHIQRSGGTQKAHLTINSVQSYLRAINGFMGWLEAERHVERATMAHLPKLRKIAREVLSVEEMRAMEDACTDERDKAIIALLAATGMREGELIGVLADDVIERERRYYVRVRGKTGERTVPIAPDLYRRLRSLAKGHHERLFLSQRKTRNGERVPLEAKGVSGIVKSAAVEAGIERRVYPHLMRHSALTDLVKSGLNPIMVSDITGVSIQVIQSNYSHLQPKDAYDALMEVRGRKR